MTFWPQIVPGFEGVFFFPVSFCFVFIIIIISVPSETYDLSIPKDDTFFNASTDRLTFTRVAAAPNTGPGTGKARQNINQRSVWLDLSQIYGRTKEVQMQLRSGINGKMRVRRKKSKKKKKKKKNTVGAFSTMVQSHFG